MRNQSTFLKLQHPAGTVLRTENFYRLPSPPTQSNTHNPLDSLSSPLQPRIPSNIQGISLQLLLLPQHPLNLSPRPHRCRLPLITLFNSRSPAHLKLLLSCTSILQFRLTPPYSFVNVVCSVLFGPIRYKVRQVFGSVGRSWLRRFRIGIQRRAPILVVFVGILGIEMALYGRCGAGRLCGLGGSRWDAGGTGNLCARLLENCRSTSPGRQV